MRLFSLLFLLMFSLGIDLSHHNKVCWDELKNDKIEFCYIKLTEGSSFIDNKARVHNNNAKKHNMKVGFYHYFRTNISGKSQLNHFKKQLDSYQYDLIPVIDIEDKNNNFCDYESVKRELEIFIEGFKEIYGYYPIVYYGSLNAYRFKSITSKCPSWYRTVHLPKIIPFTFQQIKIKKYSFGNIDINRCYDMSYISIER